MAIAELLKLGRWYFLWSLKQLLLSGCMCCKSPVIHPDLAQWFFFLLFHVVTDSEEARRLGPVLGLVGKTEWRRNCDTGGRTLFSPTFASRQITLYLLLLLRRRRRETAKSRSLICWISNPAQKSFKQDSETESSMCAIFR